MPTTFNNDGKPTYMYDSVGDVWYAVGAKIDTASGYEWGGSQTFLNTVTTDATVILRDGFNNFLNPAARDATITAPVRGTIAFVRQDAGGGTLNQIQYYNGSAWVANDGDISAVTAGTGLSGGGTAGALTVSIDTAVTADLTTAQTLTNKTLTYPKINLAFDAETASYTAILANNGQVVTMNVGSGNTFSIPTNASVAFPIGTQITVLQIGTGQTTIQAVTSGTTTILSTGATAAQPKLRVRYSAATCVKAGTDLWYVFGDIS